MSTFARLSARTPDPSVVALVSWIRSRIFRVSQFVRNHRTGSMLSAALVLVAYSYLAASATAYADSEGDMLAPFRDALISISGESPNGGPRSLLESTRYLAWDRWTGFTPSGGTFYLVSAGSALSVATNFISTLFFTMGGFILKIVGLGAAIGLSFDAVNAMMPAITRNTAMFGSLLFPSLRSDYEKLCTGEGDCGAIQVVGRPELVLALLTVFGIVMAYRITKARRRGKISGALDFSMGQELKQGAMSLIALTLISVLGFGAVEAWRVPGSAPPGSPQWVTRGAEWLATRAAGAVGVGVDVASTVLTGRSIKTGNPVGSCSNYIGALHTIYQGGTSSASTRDSFLIALDELALNSYFRLAVNSSYGSVDDTQFSGSGNAWCHRLENEAGISGHEHMLVTRLALAQADPTLNKATTDFKKYPLAASIDAHMSMLLKGTAEQKFAASSAIRSIWGPYTSPAASNSSAFYFAACNVHKPTPELLKTWGNVISADAIKVSNGIQAGGGGDGPTVQIPLGGSQTEGIFLDHSLTLREIDVRLKDAGGICGAVVTGAAVREPKTSKGPEGVGLFSFLGAVAYDSTFGAIIPFGGSAVDDLKMQNQSDNAMIRQGWSDSYRSVGDLMVANSPEHAVDFGTFSAWRDAARQLNGLTYQDLKGSPTGPEALTLYNTIAQADPNGLDRSAVSLYALTTGRRTPSPDSGIGGVVGEALDGANEAVRGSAVLTDFLKGADESPERAAYKQVAQAAITGFSNSGFAASQSFNFREPDVEFLGMGIKKMSSAAPLFAASIDNGPYDYYLATIGGNTVATLLSAVSVAFLAIAILYFMVPLIVGMVVSKFLSVLAWFFLPFLLILNILPVPSFRPVLKVGIVSIFWSHLSVVFFTSILKVMSMLITVFSEIVYNPTHPVILQTVEIMLAILMSFGIVKFVLKQYFKIDFTSFQGAVLGAGVLSGHAVFDAIGKPMGITRSGGVGKGPASDAGEAIKSLLAKRSEDSDLDKADDSNLFNPENRSTQSDEDSGSSETVGSDSEAEKAGAASSSQTSPAGLLPPASEKSDLAENLANSLTDGEHSAPKPPPSDEEVRAEAERVASDLGSGGLASTDRAATPEEAQALFKALDPNKVEAVENPAMTTPLGAVLTLSEIAPFKNEKRDQPALPGEAIDAETGKGILPQDSYNAGGDYNPALGYDNKYTNTLRLSEELSSEERADLERAASISDRLNNGGELADEDAAWLDSHRDGLASLMQAAGVEPVNMEDIHNSGSGPSAQVSPGNAAARLIAEAIEDNTKAVASSTSAITAAVASSGAAQIAHEAKHVELSAADRMSSSSPGSPLDDSGPVLAGEGENVERYRDAARDESGKGAGSLEGIRKNVSALLEGGHQATIGGRVVDADLLRRVEEGYLDTQG